MKMPLTRRRFGIGLAALLGATMLNPRPAFAGTVTKTIGSSGRDYSTLNLWAASLPANLVTDGNSYVGQCFNDSEFVSSSTLLTLAGNTVDASHTITLTTGAGQSFQDNAGVRTNALAYNVSNGVGIRKTGNYTGAIDLQVTCFVSKLQIGTSGGTNGSAIINSPGGGGVFGTIDACILDCDSSAPVVRSLIYKMRNTICIQRHSGLSTAAVDVLQTCSLFFVTIVVPSDKSPAAGALGNQNYGTATAENCAFFGCTAIGAGGSTVVTYTNCMSDVASPPSGVTGSKTYANQFVNTTNASGDWREKAGANLQGAGTADSTNGATDVSGLARPQGSNWDIGCWELAAANPPGGTFLLQQF